MRLVRLIYASTLKKDIAQSELSKIHERAKLKNLEFDITGLLVFGNDYFLQCIEGGREVVNRLYSNITADARHEHSVLLEYSEPAERDFDEWSMKVVLLKKENSKSLRRFSTIADFNPYLLSGPSAHRLMLSLRKVD